MAKKRFFFGTLAMVLALVFGLVLAGCSTDSDDGSNNNPDNPDNPDPGPSTEVTKTTFQGSWVRASGSNATLAITEGSLIFTYPNGPGNATFTITGWGSVETGDAYSSSAKKITITGTMSTPYTGSASASASSNHTTVFASGVTSLSLVYVETYSGSGEFRLLVRQGSDLLTLSNSLVQFRK